MPYAAVHPYRNALRLGLLVLALAVPARAGAGTVELISKADPVPDATGNSGLPALSADGRWVAFTSDAPNLVPGQVDGNFFPDVFLLDRLTGTTTLVTHAAGSETTAGRWAGNPRSLDVQISADGRYVAFSSVAADLIPGAADANGASDVFLYDRATGATTLISHESGAPGVPADGPSYGVRLSADGNWAVFTSEARNLLPGAPEPSSSSDVFLWSRKTGSLALVSHRSGQPNAPAGSSAGAEISADGGFVVFTSTAPDLVAGLTDANSGADVFLFQRSSGAVSLVSRASGSATTTAGGVGSRDPRISADGRWIAFASSGPDLVDGQIDDLFGLDAFLFDRVTGRTRLVSHTDGSPETAAGIVNDFKHLTLSADGRWVAFVSKAEDLVRGQVDTNGVEDVFVYDRLSGTSALVSHTRDSPTRATPDPVASGFPSLSGDGRYIAYVSGAVDVVPRQTDVRYSGDVFLFDQVSKKTVLVSHTRASQTTAANDSSGFPAISRDGKVVGFLGPASNLGEGLVNPNFFQSLFLYSRGSGEVVSAARADEATPWVSPNGPSTLAGLSRDGNAVLFLSRATGLVPGQIDQASGRSETSGSWDVFLRDRAAGRTFLVSRSASSPVTAVNGVTPALSADGKIAAFVTLSSGSPGLVYSLYLHDRAAGRLVPVNRDLPGVPLGVSLSADGRYAAWSCRGCEPPSNGTEVFFYDSVTQVNRRVSQGTGDVSGEPRISADGRFVAFLSRGQGLSVADRETGAVANVSRSASAFVMSDDGRWIAFLSTAQVFLHDRAAGTTVLVSHAAADPATAGNGAASLEDALSMSADGRFVVFESRATDLVAGVADTNNAPDVFLFDRLSGGISLVSSAGAGKASNRGATTPSISADGGRIAFLTASTDVAPGQAGERRSVHLVVLDRTTGARTLVGRVHTAGPSTVGGLISFVPRLSADGRFVAFTSDSARLVPGDLNGNWDVFGYSEGAPAGR